MSFGSVLTFDQLEALRERYVALGDRMKERTKCLHKACTECKGTGFRPNGGSCIHGIACPCPDCSFTC